MIEKIVFFFLVLFVSAFVSASDCQIDPLKNNWVIDYKEHNATDTVSMANHWYYTASGTVNENFAFSHDSNFFEIKALGNRFISHVKRPGKKKVYGQDFYGAETIRYRVHCYMHSSQTMALDPVGGLGYCDSTRFIYKVVGSSTLLYPKKGALLIKEIK